MSEANGAAYEDPWAWLDAAPHNAPVDYSRFHIVAGRAEPGDGERRGVPEAIDHPLVDVTWQEDLTADAAGDWFWLLPDDVEPTDATLTALLDRVRSEPDVAVVGPLLVEPRRRGAGTIISDWAQTITSTGRLRPLTEAGELYQGQLDAVVALGVPAGGMLVRGDAWRFLGGFNPELPKGLWGLDFGWRANLAGYRVVAEPGAQLVDHSELDSDADLRAGGMALVAGNTPAPRRWLTVLRLVLASLVTALGYLLGKDPQRAGDELRGLARWLGNGRLRRSITSRAASLPVKPDARRATRALLPQRGAGLRRAADLAAARLSEWVRTFTGRSAGASLDEMTGDDFAQVGSNRYALPLAITGLLVLLVAAVAAARGSFGTGSLTASQLLAAPDSWRQLLDSYLAPVAGADFSGAPWTGLAGVFSLVTLGRPEWLVTGVLLLAVPASWLLAFRLLRQVVADRKLAGVGALGYALAPALLGGLNSGSFGLAALAVLLPILGYSGWRWLVAEPWSWRRAGAVAFWLLLACSLAPALWFAALGLALWTAIRSRLGRAWAQWALVLLAPFLLLAGGWGATILRYPGRLLTGIEPALAPATAAPALEVFLGRTLAGAAPLWLVIVFYAACWLLAALGGARRPATAGAALAFAGLATLAAVWLTRLVVEVPPGTWVRPLGLEWSLLAIGGLVLAACLGLDGLLVELRGHDLGLRHLANLVVVGFGVVGIGLAGAWWVLGGQSGLVRSPVGDVPAFVRNAQVSPTPGRTLFLAAGEDKVSWSLLEGDFARLGQSERGLAYSGNPAALQLAASVVARLVGDTSDDQLVPDLVRLGVSHVTLSGGDGHQRQAIDNVPGMGIGTGTANQYVWPVPDSGIAVVEAGEVRQLVGTGVEVPNGSGDRVLRLAEPADSRRQVRVGGQVLAPAEGGDPGTTYALGAASGKLEIDLPAASTGWLWLQLAGLGLLAVLAAPSVRRREEAGPRRAAGGEA